MKFACCLSVEVKMWYDGTHADDACETENEKINVNLHEILLLNSSRSGEIRNWRLMTESVFDFSMDTRSIYIFNEHQMTFSLFTIEWCDPFSQCTRNRHASTFNFAFFRVCAYLFITWDARWRWKKRIRKEISSLGQSWREGNKNSCITSPSMMIHIEWNLFSGKDWMSGEEEVAATFFSPTVHKPRDYQVITFCNFKQMLSAFTSCNCVMCNETLCEYHFLPFRFPVREMEVPYMEYLQRIDWNRSASQYSHLRSNRRCKNENV